MTVTTSNLIRGLCLALILFAGAEVSGAEDTDETANTAGAANSFGDDVPRIKLNLNAGTLKDALTSVARQTRWGLVLNAPDQLLDKKITLMLPRIPADRAVTMLLENSGLVYSFEDGVLIIRQADPAPTAAKAVDVQADPPSSQSDTGSEILIEDFEDLKNMKERWKDKKRGKWRDHRPGKDKSGTSRVEIGGPVSVQAGETVAEAVSIGDNTTVAGTVERDAVSVGGNLHIQSGARVGKDAVAVGGDVTVDSGAVIEGEAVAVGGKVHVADGAEIKGDRVSVNIPLPPIQGIAGAMGLAGMFWVLAAVLRSIFIFAIALIIVWIAPERVAVTRDYLVHRAGGSLLSGFLIFLGFIPLCILLAATIIGIPLVPILALFLAAVVIFGLTAMLSWFGYWLPVFRNRKSPIGALVIGFLIFLVINMIPIAGGIFMFLSGLAAAGATFLSRFGKKPREV